MLSCPRLCLLAAFRYPRAACSTRHTLRHLNCAYFGPFSLFLPTRTLDEHDICCNRARSLPVRHREGVMLEVLPCQEKALERGFPAPAAPPESGSLALLTAL